MVSKTWKFDMGKLENTALRRFFKRFKPDMSFHPRHICNHHDNLIIV